jgi:hypothetical protein
MVASSIPNCDGSSDCHLVGLFNDFRHITIYKLFDKSWTIVESDKYSGSSFIDKEIIGTKLYVISSSNSIWVSDSILVYCLKDSINGPPKAKVLAKCPIISLSEFHIWSNTKFSFLGKYEALRELYLIYVFCNKVPTYETQRLTNKDPIGWPWQDVQLEDRVTFVGDLNNIVMSRDELNFNKDLIRGNFIYFAFHFQCPTNPWSGLQLGMFCLTDRSIKYFPVETLKYDDIPYCYPVWFVPSLL